MIVVHFISGIQSGGVEQMLVNYTVKLNAEYGLKQYIIYQHSPDCSSLSKLESAGNSCIRVASKIKHPFKNFIQTYKIIKQLQPDVVHCHMNLFNFIPLIAAFILRVPLRICHSHIATNNIHSKIIPVISKKLNIYFSNMQLACGQLAGQYMYGNIPFKILNNAIDTKKFVFNSHGRNKIREKYNLAPNDFLIGNVGRFTEQKNQVFLIKVFVLLLKKKHNIKLFIIGQGDKEDEIRQLISENFLTGKVFLISPKINIDDYYSAMDIFLLPSLYEGFPVVAVEVQVSGLPFIMSDTIDKTAIMSSSGLTAPLDNCEEWIDRIDTIEKNFSMNNRSLINWEILKKYDVSLCYDELWMLYKSKN